MRTGQEVWGLCWDLGILIAFGHSGTFLVSVWFWGCVRFWGLCWVLGDFRFKRTEALFRSARVDSKPGVETWSYAGFCG